MPASPEVTALIEAASAAARVARWPAVPKAAGLKPLSCRHAAASIQAPRYSGVPGGKRDRLARVASTAQNRPQVSL